MKLYTRIAACAAALVIAAALAMPAAAEGLSDAVPDSARDMLGGLEPDVSMDVGAVLGDILRTVLFGGESPIKEAAANAGAVLAAALLTALCTSFTGEKEGISAPKLAGLLAIAAIAVNGARGLIGSAQAVTEDIYAFSAALLPTLAAAAAASGTAAASAAGMAAATLFLNLLISLSRDVIIPLIYAFVAASCASAAFGGAVHSAARLIKWVINSLLIALSTAFTVYISVTGIVAAQADAAAVKLTKTAVANLVPVVGKLISDAAEAVASGFSVVCGAAGVFGMVVIIALCAGPVVRAAANYLFFKAAAALSEAVAGREMAAFIGDLGTAMGFSAATAALSGAMLLVSAAVTVKAATG